MREGSYWTRAWAAKAILVALVVAAVAGAGSATQPRKASEQACEALACEPKLIGRVGLDLSESEFFKQGKATGGDAIQAALPSGWSARPLVFKASPELLAAHWDFSKAQSSEGSPSAASIPMAQSTQAPRAWDARSLGWALAALAALAAAVGLIFWLRARGIWSPPQRAQDSGAGRDLFNSLSNAAEVGVIVCDKDGCIIESNALFERWAGKAKKLTDLSGGRARQDLLDAFSMGAQNKAKVRWEGWVGEGEAKAMASLVMVPFEDAKGYLLYVGALRDASEKGRLEMRLAFERDKAERLMESVNEAVLYLDAYGHVERASSGMLELLGKTGQDVRGLWVGHVLRLVDRFEAVEAPIEELLAKGRVDSDRWLVERGSGELAPMELRWSKLRDESLEGVMSLRDISARVSEMDKMKWEASHDALTGLLNRRAFGLAIEELQLRMARERTPTAILTIDLDGFKEVNDIHGHEFGDEILKLVAEALIQASAPFDYVARLGGDEFVVVMQGIGADGARAKIQEFERAVTCATVKTPKGLARVGASIGVAELAVDDAKAAKALRHADGEMYAIKKARKSGRA